MAKDPEDLEELEDDEVEDEDIDVEEAEAALPAAGDDEDGEEEASLDELLAQRAAGKRGAEEGEDEPDIMALTSQPEVIPSVDALTGKVIPIKDRQEFVCNNCHLVKARSQLADEARGLCRDCV